MNSIKAENRVLVLTVLINGGVCSDFLTEYFCTDLPDKRC